MSRDIGRQGEELAVSYLRNEGYEILERNFRTRWGEIDIIARHDGDICFVEVKARRSLNFGHPAEAVHSRKQEKILRVAQGYLQKKHLLESPVRFDVLSIHMPGENTPPAFELIRDAFSA